MQALGNRDFSLQVISSGREDWSKAQIDNMSARIEKSKNTLFSQTLEVQKAKYPFFHFWPQAKLLTICAID